MPAHLQVADEECVWPDEPTEDGCIQGYVEPWDGDVGTDFSSGIPTVFGLFFVLVLVLGVGSAIWRVSTARRMARDAGLDQGDATTMALLSDEGLSTTYLASSLRARPDVGPAEQQPADARPVAERLRELAALREEGLITDDEHDARRRAIIEEI